MGFSEAPLTLQRGCAVKFTVRDEKGRVRAEAAALHSAVSAARLLLKGAPERVWVDATMIFDKEPVNEQARRQRRMGGVELRLAAWEIFADDVVYCPAGSRLLAPDYFAAALALQEDDPRELVEA